MRCAAAAAVAHLAFAAHVGRSYFFVTNAARLTDRLSTSWVNLLPRPSPLPGNPSFVVLACDEASESP